MSNRGIRAVASTAATVSCASNKARTVSRVGSVDMDVSRQITVPPAIVTHRAMLRVIARTRILIRARPRGISDKARWGIFVPSLIVARWFSPGLSPSGQRELGRILSWAPRTGRRRAVPQRLYRTTKFRWSNNPSRNVRGHLRTSPAAPFPLLVSCSRAIFRALRPLWLSIRSL